MSATNYSELDRHRGHDVEVANYGGVNAVVECLDCAEVLVSYDVDGGDQ